MQKRFKVLFLREAREFLEKLDEKTRDKIIFNIDIVKIKNDKERFRKLTGNIWEFRTLFKKKYFRLFAFWDKTSRTQTLVISTHGMVKKTSKTPKSEIEKAEKIRIKYFELKQKTQ